MGAPHNGDSNGGTDQLKLTTTVTDLFTGDTTGSDEDTIKVDGLSTAVSGVPAEVTAGGPAATFDAAVDNPAASKYQNVTGTLLTSKYASVQVLRSGTWKTLTPVTSKAEPDVYGFNVLGKDASLAEHSSAVTKVRVTYRKDTPAGKSTVQPCIRQPGGEGVHRHHLVRSEGDCAGARTGRHRGHRTHHRHGLRRRHVHPDRLRDPECLGLALHCCPHPVHGLGRDLRLVRGELPAGQHRKQPDTRHRRGGGFPPPGRSRDVGCRGQAPPHPGLTSRTANPGGAGSRPAWGGSRRSCPGVGT